MTFFSELKRRNVFRVGAAYVVVAWLLIEVAETIFPLFGFDTTPARIVVIVLTVGFIPAVIFSWVYELTAEGLIKEKDVDRSQSVTYATGRKLDFAIIGLLAIALIVIGGNWFMSRDARWARDEAFPMIESYVAEGDWEAAYQLGKIVEIRLPNSSKLANLWPTFSRATNIPSDPSGAKVYRRSYSATDSEWEELGTTPLRNVRIPFGISLIRLEIDDRPPLLRMIGSGLLPEVDDLSVLFESWPVDEEQRLTYIGILPYTYKLDTESLVNDGFERVPGWEVDLDSGPVEFGEFFIGRKEITNREFKEFTNAGGYQRRDFWQHEFIQDGEIIPWEDAMALLTDQTGRPGPKTWVAGTFPDGEDDYPVAGVSWYEAAAYARFVGRELPTVHHWRRAFAFAILPWMLPASNLDGDRTAPVGQYRGIGWTGTYDMAGNVREWCQNSVGDQRVILGGGWNDAFYVVQESIMDAGSLPPLDRSITNGFRIAFTNDDLATAARARQAIPEPNVPIIAEPASDEVFAAYRAAYDYDPTPLNATIEETESATDWYRERITFDAAYDDERITLDLYLPSNERSRHQAVLIWPGTGALLLETRDTSDAPLDYVLKNGRAVAFPIYKGTFERRQPEFPDWTTVSGRDLTIQQIKDLRRTIDYLESREDIDNDGLAFYGQSWGGRLGGIVLAIEPRIRVGVLDQAGINFDIRPEIDVTHYLQRVTQPVLQFNGRYDSDFRYETSAKPYFDLLGTPEAHKKHVVEPTGHFVSPSVAIGETLNWLDKYLGPSQ